MHSICVFYRIYQLLLLYTLARLIVNCTSAPTMILWLLWSTLVFLGYDFGDTGTATDVPGLTLLDRHTSYQSFANMTLI